MMSEKEAKHMIREQCYLCIMTVAANPPTAAQTANTLPEEHKRFLVTLHRERRILGSGKLENSSEGEHSDLGFGMFILRASSRKEAEHIALQEPYTKAGYRLMRLIPWQRNALE